MTKEQFIEKWGDLSKPLKNDIDSVIANEIAKVKPQPSDKVQISKHTLVEVNRAFRALKQDRNSYIHKVFSDDGVFDAMEEIRKMFDNYFVEQPQEAKPALNQIEEAYERGDKIRKKTWASKYWIKKISETESIDEIGDIWGNAFWDFKTKPEKWELYIESTEQTSSQVKVDNSSMTYEEAVKHIISNKLTHKKACNDSWFAYKFYGYNIHFCDESGKDMIWVRFDELDLTEWYPYKKQFDKDRFEAMFRAVVASGRNGGYIADFEETEKAIQQLDAYYSEKQGGNNE